MCTGVDPYVASLTPAMSRSLSSVTQDIVFYALQRVLAPQDTHKALPTGTTPSVGLSRMPATCATPQLLKIPHSLLVALLVEVKALADAAKRTSYSCVGMLAQLLRDLICALASRLKTGRR